MKLLIFRVLSAICMPLLLIILGFALGEPINLGKLLPHLLLFYLALAFCVATNWKELQRPHHFSRYRRKKEARCLRKREAGYKYIYVYNDGSARELSAEEQQRLNERQPIGGGRLYIKTNYEQVNGWGKMSGFMERRQLPTEIPIGPVPADKKDFYSPASYWKFELVE